MKLMCMVNDGEMSLDLGPVDVGETPRSFIARAKAALGDPWTMDAMWEVHSGQAHGETPAGDTAMVYPVGPVEDRAIPIGQRFWIENVDKDDNDANAGPEAIWTRVGPDHWVCKAGDQEFVYDQMDYDTIFDGVQRFHFL